MEHVMQLQPEPFGFISRGHKTIEARLFDEKRKRVDVGDMIVFSRSDGELGHLVADVVGLSRFRSFANMFEALGVAAFGFTSEVGPAAAGELMRKYYDAADEERFGVLGIHLRVIDQLDVQSTRD